MVKIKPKWLFFGMTRKMVTLKLGYFRIVIVVWNSVSSEDSFLLFAPWTATYMPAEKIVIRFKTVEEGS